MKKLEESFKKVRYIGWETSMSPIVEREKKTMKYQVGWNEEEERGWFEMYDEESGGEDYYAEGCLEFTGKVLDGYDGVFSLDEEVVNRLEKMGADVKQMREDLEL
tara:strand:- start:142 stop:456 length:315 start_codon:yes stop_codon:yes gene_type:complete